eukprot:3799341-Amphidinium_carterae.1
MSDIVLSSLGLAPPYQVKWSRQIATQPFLSEFQEAEVWLWHVTDKFIHSKRWLDSQMSRKMLQDQ